MPAKVIATVHQLAAACKKYKGIVFMDKEGNIINDDNNDNYNNTSEITGVDTTNNVTITGVDTNNDTNNDTITGVDTNNNTNNDEDTNNNTLEITGVHDNMEDTETATETQVNNNEHNTAPYTDSEPNDRA